MKQAMKAPFLFFAGLAFAVALVGCGSQQSQQAADKAEKPAYKYEYETAENDPTNTLIYTLDNGLKVYMSVYRDEPRVQTAIAVRAGSKNDPADATGLAHYLEHMLFKGNSEIASLDWEKEKVLLQEISDLYEQHRNTDDPDEKAAIYKQIDEKSTEAAKYVAPNEYDKMISSLGAKGTNAFTSTERTVYINDIPANELNKWAKVEGSRFKELTLRLFHTELETVYEEFNRGQDSDGSKAYKEMASLLFQNHPYGTQTTIGTGEHLKNPSMVKIHEYFDTYYVPNNVAICLSGDIDPDATVDLIKESFGDWQRKDVPEFTFTPEEPITEPIEAEVLGPQAERVMIGWRFGGTDSDDPRKLDLVSALIYNGQAGLIDLNLVQQQKILRGFAFGGESKDYSSMTFYGYAKQGQSLEEVRDLLLEQIEKVKAGDFDDETFNAVVRNMKKDQERGLESNWSRAYQAVDAFILRKDWQTAVNELDEMGKITKDELVKWANEKFGDNYAVVYKRTGEDPNVHKVDKPEITPLDINRDEQSQFLQAWDKIESIRLDPLFVDYENDINTTMIGDKVPLMWIENETNDLFTMYYVLNMGTDNIPELELAVDYLQYLGTDKYSAEQLQKEMYKLAVDFGVFAGDDRVYVYLSGLEESLEEGVQLFEHLLANCQPNDDARNELISDMMKSRDDAKKSKGAILYNAMTSYAMYGPENSFNNQLTEEELRAITSDQLVEMLHGLTSYKHDVQYYGSKQPAEVAAVLEQHHQLPAELKDYPEAKKYEEVATEENKVYFVDYDMRQAEMMFISRAELFDKTKMPSAQIFNEYFGSGLSSIVFQEIREGKALAYSAWSSFGTPSKADEHHYVRGYLGTQVEKTGEAVDAMMGLLNDMPEAQEQFEAAKLAALKKIETDRITKTAVFWNYRSAQDRGLDYDIRKDNYAAIKDMSMADLKAFFEQNVKGRTYTFLVIGKKGDVDMDALAKIGPVQELTLEEIFGY